MRLFIHPPTPHSPAALSVVMVLVVGLVCACGPDITFDDSARDHIGEFDPDRQRAEPDIGGTDAGSELLTSFDHTAWDGLTSRYVVGACFAYTELEASPEALDLLALTIDQLERADLTAASSPDDRAALWINAYNALTIAGIVAERRDDPTFRVDVADFAFFSDRRFVVGGQLLSLDLIEHGILRRDDGHDSMTNLDDDDLASFIERERQRVAEFDPRWHFAINCGSRSCPDLRAESYRGETLDSQLDAQATVFLDDPNRGAGPAGVSMLFSWFRADFEAVAPIDEFIAEFRTAELPAAATDQFLPYDWGLNDNDESLPLCQP